MNNAYSLKKKEQQQSRRESRYKFATIRQPRKPAQRRQSSQSSSTYEIFQDEDSDSYADLKSTPSNSLQSGSDEEEEFNQGVNNSKSLRNQGDYITPITRKVYSRCSNDQYQTVNPLISVRKSSMKGCRQIQKASASQQCENGCESSGGYADKPENATLGNPVNHAT